MPVREYNDNERDAINNIPGTIGVLAVGSNLKAMQEAINAGGGGGEANTGANVGAGDGIFRNKTGVTLNLKSLTAGAGVTLTPSANEIEIAASGSAEPLEIIIEPGAGPFVDFANIGTAQRTMIIFTNASAKTLTSIVGAGAAGRVLYIAVTGGTLTMQAFTGTAGNQISVVGGVTVALPQGDTITLAYIGAFSLWGHLDRTNARRNNGASIPYRPVVDFVGFTITDNVPGLKTTIEAPTPIDTSDQGVFVVGDFAFVATVNPSGGLAFANWDWVRYGNLVFLNIIFSFNVPGTSVSSITVSNLATYGIPPIKASLSSGDLAVAGFSSNFNLHHVESTNLTAMVFETNPAIGDSGEYRATLVYPTD